MSGPSVLLHVPLSTWEANLSVFTAGWLDSQREKEEAAIVLRGLDLGGPDITYTFHWSKQVTEPARI